MTLQELIAKRQAAVAKMNGLVEKAQTEKRDLTAEEIADFDKADAEAKSLSANIKRLEGLADHEATLDAVRQPAAARGNGPVRAGGPEAKKEFGSLAEFMYAVRFNNNDPRLDYQEGSNATDQRMDTGSTGGFAIPKQFIPTLRQVGPAGSSIRPRATVIEAGDPPDAEVTMPALDQSTTNIFGGVQVQWTGEGDTVSDTNATFKEISLKPQEVSAMVTLTNKLLRNWGAASSVIENLLRGAIIATEEAAFLNGDGVAKPKGLLKSGALLTVHRNTANTVKFVDIASMFANFIDDGDAVWLINPRLKSVIMQLADGAGRLVWLQGNVAQGIPETLLGVPIIWTRYGIALGTTGDVILASLKNYLIKDGSGPLVSTSEHVKFASNKTVIKIVWNVDGQSWLNAPIKSEDGVNSSPFIALTDPAG